MSINYIVVEIIGFISGLICGYLLFNRRYIRYKLYWEQWKLDEGNYKSVREFAKLEDVSIKQRMEDIKRKVDYYNN